MDEPREHDFTFSPKAPIAIPSDESERRLMIREMDWKRIRSRIGDLADAAVEDPAIWSAWASSVGTAALFALLSLLGAGADAPGWWWVIHLTLGLGGLALGVFMRSVERRMKTDRRETAQAVCDDMEEVEATFQTPKTPPPSITI